MKNDVEEDDVSTKEEDEGRSKERSERSEEEISTTVDLVSSSESDSESDLESGNVKFSKSKMKKVKSECKREKGSVITTTTTARSSGRRDVRKKVRLFFSGNVVFERK